MYSNRLGYAATTDSTLLIDGEGAPVVQYAIDPLYIAPSDTTPTTIDTVTTQAIAPSGTTIATDLLGDIYVYLYFKDEHGKPLAVDGQLINLANGEVLSTISKSYEANISAQDVPASQLGVVFTAPGYKTVKSTVDQLQLLTDPKTIFFQKGFGTVIIFEAAALLALLLFLKSQKKKMGAFDKTKAIGIMEVVALGIGLFLAYRLVKNILDFLGVTKSQSTATLDNAEQDPNSFWNPNYYLTIKPAGANWTYAITYDQAAQWVQDLQDCFGAFNDDEEGAIAIFKNFRTKANASYFSAVFQRITGEDLLHYLRGGWWPQDRLSDADVYTINNYINSLPNY